MFIGHAILQFRSLHHISNALPALLQARNTSILGYRIAASGSTEAVALLVVEVRVEFRQGEASQGALGALTQADGTKASITLRRSPLCGRKALPISSITPRLPTPREFRCMIALLSSSIFFCCTTNRLTHAFLGRSDSQAGAPVIFIAGPLPGCVHSTASGIQSFASKGVSTCSPARF